ncbi:MAG: fimbrillin family protein [Mediterranea sp.]|jgi:hypothetical protein|nr:fimbrillin family protein [Mediterranea sp.]
MKQRAFLSGAIATTLALLSSCNQSVWNEADSSPGTSQEFITLKALTGKTNVQQTRVAETTTATLQEFTIYGRINESGVEDSIFDQRKVTKTEAGAWSYGAPKKWPDRYGTISDGFQYEDVMESTYTTSFLAISPAASPNLSKTADGNVLPGITDWTAKDVYYTVPTNFAEQEDLLIALTKGHQPGTQIDLAFNHLLSKVEFYARSKQKSVTFNITEVGLKNVHNQGKIKQDLLTDGSTTTGKWGYTNDSYRPTLLFEPTGNKVSYVKSFGEPVSVAYHVNPNHYTSVASGDDGFFVLPQQTKLGTAIQPNAETGTDDFYVMVSYEIQLKEGEKLQKTLYFPVEQKLDYSRKGFIFEAGRKYRFKITLEDKDVISLDVDYVGDMDYKEDDYHNTYLPDQEQGQYWPIGSTAATALGIANGIENNGAVNMALGVWPDEFTESIDLDALISRINSADSKENICAAMAASIAIPSELSEIALLPNEYNTTIARSVLSTVPNPIELFKKPAIALTTFNDYLKANGVNAYGTNGTTSGIANIYVDETATPNDIFYLSLNNYYIKCSTSDSYATKSIEVYNLQANGEYWIDSPYGTVEVTYKQLVQYYIGSRAEYEYEHSQYLKGLNRP